MKFKKKIISFQQKTTWQHCKVCSEQKKLKGILLHHCLKRKSIKKKHFRTYNFMF